jgi:hypothetical protein
MLLFPLHLRRNRAVPRTPRLTILRVSRLGDNTLAHHLANQQVDVLVRLPKTFLGEKGKPVAVGTAIAARPPHRSVRAALPHTALTLDDGVEAKLHFAHAA